MAFVWHSFCPMQAAVRLLFGRKRLESTRLLGSAAPRRVPDEAEAFFVFGTGFSITTRQAAFFGSYPAMGAMQTAVVALALGKNSPAMACEISLRFGARPAEIMALL